MTKTYRTTKIAWTQHTWNPIRGCTKISAGCDNCYAERMAKRFPDHEAGYPAKNEFGIEGWPKIKDERRRFCRNAFICARLIKRHCINRTGTELKRFGMGYDYGSRKYPGYAEDPDWWIKVRRHTRKYKNLLY